MPPLRLLSPYPTESEAPATSPDTLQNEPNCGRTTPEKSLAQIGRAINEWGPTTDSVPGLIGGYLAKLPQSLLLSIGCVLILLVGIFRYERPFTLVCLDLDNFKTLNDCFGHSAGDILLRLVAHTLRENIRVTDTVARLGGDEFAILLPETGRNVAEVMMQRIQKINWEITRKHGWPVTLSIGVADLHKPTFHG